MLKFKIKINNNFSFTKGESKSNGCYGKRFMEQLHHIYSGFAPRAKRHELCLCQSNYQKLAKIITKIF